MTFRRLRRAARVLPLSLLLLVSCNEQLLMVTDDTAAWKVEWSLYIDVKCIASSNREVASRSRIVGTSNFKVVRPSGDERAEVPLDNLESATPTTSISLFSNCDPAAHGNARIVTEPKVSEPWTVSGAVVSHPGIDSLRLTITGRFDPAVVRLEMTDGTVIEGPIVGEVHQMTITVPYSVSGRAVNVPARSPSPELSYSSNVALKYQGPL